MRTPYINEWETERVVESADLRARGIIPMKKDLKSGRVATIEKYKWKQLLMGQAAGAIERIETAEDIVNGMVAGAVDCMKRMGSLSRGENAAAAELALASTRLGARL